MVELKNIIEIDDKEVKNLLKDTTLKMPNIIIKMQHAVNRVVIKKAKSNFKSSFDANNHSKTVLNGSTKKILSSFKTLKNKKIKASTYVINQAFYAKFLELGADIKAKSKKYLTFKVNGEWRKCESITLPAKPFLQPALEEVWNSGEAKNIQMEALQKELNKYWAKMEN